MQSLNTRIDSLHQSILASHGSDIEARITLLERVFVFVDFDKIAAAANTVLCCKEVDLGAELHQNTEPQYQLSSMNDIEDEANALDSNKVGAIQKLDAICPPPHLDVQPSNDNTDGQTDSAPLLGNMRDILQHACGEV